MENTMKKSTTKRKFFQNIPEATSVAALTLLFSYFAIKAFVKFWDEPTTTKIYYTLGDIDHRIQFPLASICNFYFALENPVLQKCGNGSDRFLRALRNCYENDKSFKIENLMNSLDYER